MIEKGDLAKFIANECITWSNPPMYGLAPGSRYTYILQLAPLLMNVDMMHFVAVYFDQMIQTSFDPNKIQIAGGEPNSLPILTAINMFRKNVNLEPLNAFWIRNQRKTYGPHNVIEGKIVDKTVLLFYDMANSTNTFLKCETVCRNLGLSVAPFNFAILNKNNHGERHPWKDKNSGREIKSILEWNDINAHLTHR